MKAMIFAAGLGSRLRPLTDTTPKALIEVGGVPMLERVTRRLIAAGVNRIVVNVHHHADSIEHFLRNNNNFGADIAISNERELLLDTGGGVVKASALLTDGRSDEPIMLYNADILTDFPIEEMLAEHIAGRAAATLLVSTDRPSTRGFLFDDNRRLCGWINHVSGEVRSPLTVPEGAKAMAFGGIHIINPELIETMTAYGRNNGEIFSLTPFYTATCDQNIYRAYIPHAPYRWVDIGRPDTLEQARLMFD